MIESSIHKKFDELTRTKQGHHQFKARLGSLRDLIKQYNCHVEDKYRLVEVSQHPSKYELREVSK